MLDFLTKQLENDFLSGGMALMVLASIGAYLRHIPKYTYRLLHRRFVTTIDVSDQDDAFYWIQQWLSKHPYSKKSRLLTVSTKKSGTDSIQEVEEDEPIDPTEGIEIFFTPAPGIHILRFEKHWILMSRIREKQQGSGSNNMFWREMIIMKTFVRDREYFRRLFTIAMKIALPKSDRKVNIYSREHGYWAIVTRRPLRDINSVILRTGLMESIIKETKEFLESADWYHDRGIPYQKGYLLYGTPGNGKTSLVLALASKFNRDIYIMKIAGTTDNSFRDLIAKVPKHSIVLIEDIDCFFVKRKSQVEANIIESNLTFSGFLNAIDGVTGSNGRILIMTTNNIQDLDPALIRPGRIDRKIELLNPTRDQTSRLFLRFFPEDKSASQRFADSLPNNCKFSMADLQGILLDNRDNPDNAIMALAQNKAA